MSHPGESPLGAVVGGILRRIGRNLILLGLSYWTLPPQAIGDVLEEEIAVPRLSTNDVLEQLFRGMGKSDPGTLAGLFAEKVDWEIAGSEAVPWIRPRSTRADVADHFRTLAAHTVPERARTTIDRVLIDRDDAVVFGRFSRVARATGREFGSAFVLRVTVEDGLITRYQVFEDSLAVARAFTPAAG